jgi:general secretion pathway protein D
VTVLPLRHVKAATVMDLLQGFISRSGLVRAASRGNLLLLRGTAQERESLAGIAQSFDVDAMSSQSAAIAVLRNSAPEEVIPHLKSISQADPEASATSLVRFEPLPRLNAILILAPDKAQVNEALAWVARFDQATEEGANYYIYRVQNAKASSLTRILNDAFGQEASPASGGETEGRRSSPPTSPEGLVDNVQGGSQGSMGGDTAMSPPPAGGEVRNEPATPVSGGADGVRITANNSTNSLIIRAPARTWRQIQGILRQIDKPSVQVLINVMIAEVTLTDNLRYGVEAYLEKNHFTVLDATQLPLEPKLPGLNVLIGKADGPKAVLDALSAITNVRVVSSPSVVTLDNQAATIKVGNQVPITTQQAISTQTANAPLVNSIEYRDSGVILRVTPRVSETDLVTMDVSQELSAVVTPTNGGTTLTPTLSQRLITSTIAVYNRQTVVLGGLISSQDSKDKQSIPMINQIPVLGDLLSRNDNKTTRTELVVFITPKVIRDSIDASRVSEEVRNALHLLNN